MKYKKRKTVGEREKKTKKKTSNHSELHPKKKKRKSHKSSIKEGNLERTNLASPERKERIQKKKDPNQYTDTSQ